jgi:hypothetical protein
MPAAPQPIRTVITSRPPQHFDKTHELETKKTAKPPTGKRRNKHRQTKKPNINIWGDSHARGIASELLHQLNYSYKINGHVKPNAGLSEVLKTDKTNLSGLTKRDTIIVAGGSNDLDKNVHRRNLTSLVKFLDDSQNTNIILTDVPMRNDLGGGSTITEQVTNYNRKLHKVTKRFRHVNLAKVTTNTEHFTKHGFHLNRIGKETLSKELIKYLPTKQCSQKTAVIQLPWGDEFREAGVKPPQTEELKESSDIDTAIVVEDAKKMCNTAIKKCIETETTKDGNPNASPSFSEQQVDTLEYNCTQTQSTKDTGSHAKSHRNCPKIRNDDFFMELKSCNKCKSMNNITLYHQNI